MTKFWGILFSVSLLFIFLTGAFWIPLVALGASSLGLGYEAGRRTKPRSLDR